MGSAYSRASAISNSSSCSVWALPMCLREDHCFPLFWAERSKWRIKELCRKFGISDNSLEDRKGWLLSGELTSGAGKHPYCSGMKNEGLGSSLDDAIVRANRDTGGIVIVTNAVNAKGGVDDVGIITRRNGMNRAFGFACATHDAVIINFMCHNQTPFMLTRDREKVLVFVRHDHIDGTDQEDNGGGENRKARDTTAGFCCIKTRRRPTLPQ